MAALPLAMGCNASAREKVCKPDAGESNLGSIESVNAVICSRKPQQIESSLDRVTVHNKFMLHSIGLTFAIAALRAPGMVTTNRRQRWIGQPVVAMLLGSTVFAAAQPTVDNTPAQEPTSSAPAAPERKPSTGTKPKLRGALTAVVGWGPDYLGASSSGLSYKPGFLLQYGRWSLSSRGSFAASAEAIQGEELPRGLGFRLLGDEQDWLRLSLRVDSGRRSKGVSGLMGIDDVPRTVRLRMSGQVNLLGGWTLTPAANIDLLSRGVGHTLDLNLSRDWALTSRVKFATHMGLTWGTRQYLNSYFGVTAAESLASGYVPYTANEGLRDVRIGVGLHYDISQRWIATANTGVQHLVGPAAQSPIARSTTHWGVGAGLGWRF